jgi:chromate transport protein ChrA
MVIAWQYAAWRDQAWAGQIFAGLRPAILMLIIFSAARFTRATIRTPLAGFVYGGSLIALVAAKLHPVVVIVAALAISLARWALFRSGLGGEEGDGGVC